MNPKKLRTLMDLKKVLNSLPDETLQQNIIFGLVDDTLEDSWTIGGIRPITEEEAEDEDLPQHIIPGKLILHP